MQDIITVTSAQLPIQMQFEREATQGNIIRAFDEGKIRIGDRWISGHLIVSAQQIIESWDIQGPQEISRQTLAPALALEPTIIIVGTGLTATLPDVALMEELAAQGTGIEFMDTPAACRTYNVLAHEHREVVAALYNPS